MQYIRMERTKHQKILLYLSGASILIQLLLIFKWFRDFIFDYFFLGFLIIGFYIFIVCYLFYVLRYYARSIFKTYTAVTISSIIFSLPVILGLLLLYITQNTKSYVVSIFKANGKTYKEIKWYYKTGELYSVQYWSTQDKAPLSTPIKIDPSNIENIHIDENKIREFGHFASENETGDDMERDSIWLKLEKNGDTIEMYRFDK